MVEIESSPEKVALPPALDITTVQIWHENFNNYCDNRNYATLCGSTVEKITSPGIQLLVSLSKKLSECDGQLKVEESSSAMLEAFGDFGLMELIKKWSREA